MILSTSNLKMNNEGIKAGTIYKTRKNCLKSCPFYKKGCYGVCGNLARPNAIEKQYFNTLEIESLLKKDNALSDILHAETIALKVDYVRFSGKGELSNIDEFLQYVRLAKLLPNKKFIIYTRKIDIIEQCINAIPSNFKVNLSTTGMNALQLSKCNRLANTSDNIGLAQVFLNKEALLEAEYIDCSESEGLSYVSKKVGLISHAHKAARKRSEALKAKKGII